MVYDAGLAARLTLATAMTTGSATEGIETVQSAEQSGARQACRLPVDMKPSREAFESLGFTFTDIDDDVLCQATLPDGWSLKGDLGGYWTDLIDDRGRTRGSYFYKGAFYDRNGNMGLCARFYVTYRHVVDEDWGSPVIVYINDACGEVVFEAGQCDALDSKEYDDLCELAEDYLWENYPDWKDPLAYW